MKFELIKKVPIVGSDGKRCFLDTGFPHASMPVAHGVQEFFGILGLPRNGNAVGVDRYLRVGCVGSKTASDDMINCMRIKGVVVPLQEKVVRTVGLEGVVRYCLYVDLGG